MADAPTQNGRIGKLATPLGKDKLCLTRFEGTEAIGELFEYHIEALSTDANINFKTALGKTCSVHLETTDHAGRDFGGILTKAKWAGTRFKFQVYQLVLRPWPWLLSLRSYCRIFSNMKVKAIIKEALGNNSFGQIVDLMVEEGALWRRRFRSPGRPLHRRSDCANIRTRVSTSTRGPCSRF